MDEATYILGHSPAEIRRLINQAAIIGTTAERLLQSAGIERGMRSDPYDCVSLAVRLREFAAR